MLALCQRNSVAKLLANARCHDSEDLVPPEQADGSDEATMIALDGVGVSEKVKEQAVKMVSKERIFLWSMEAVKSFVGVDYLGFGSMRIGVSGVMHTQRLAVAHGGKPNKSRECM